MRVEMKWDLDGSLQPTHQMVGVEGGQESGHVLDTNRIRPQIFQLLGQIHKPVDAMDRADGVTDGGFRMFAAGFHFADGPIEIPHVVKGVEDAEDIDAVRGRPFDEPLHHVVGVMAIADQVLSAQQHLELGVGHGGPQGPEPFPGIFFEEAQAGVESGAAPDFQRPIADPIKLLRDGQHVFRAHARRQQRLMAVPQRDIRDQDRFTGGRRDRELAGAGRDAFRGLDRRSGRSGLFLRFLRWWSSFRHDG